MALPVPKVYTIDDIYELPEGRHAELFDGQIYDMAPPGRTHQRLSNRLSQKITNYIDENHGSCEVYPAPFAVFLCNDDLNYVEPDLSVICNPNRLDEKGCHGAPDWVIEITSPSSAQRDYGIKLFKYRTAGVREYWIVNPLKSAVLVYDLAQDDKTNLYTFDEPISGCIFPDLSIQISELL